MAAPEYPSRWVGRVVLHDGRSCHVRPIEPDDAVRLQEFHGRLSDRTIYYRFFTAYSTLSDRDVWRFTHVDYVDRLGLVGLMDDAIVGVARFDRISPTVAEVAFVVRDDVQGLGLGSALLMRLAAAARDCGITRFTAEVLPENRRMLATFEGGGYTLERRRDGTVLHVEFDIATA